MKTICITGATTPDLQIVADILLQAGMKTAHPAKREDLIDIAFWHEKVTAQAAEESSTAQALSNPGRVWDQLASDIFVANINAPVWGWADTRSTWLLDYWCDFEPRFYAILVCVSPQQMLARAIATQTEAVSVDAIMVAWQQQHQELLRFHHRNPQRSLLVDVSQCADNPQALIERCALQWKLPLTPLPDAAPVGINHGPLALYLAYQLAQDYPQTASLQHELAATLTGLASTKTIADSIALAPDPAHFIADYRALRDRSRELLQVKATQEQLDAVKTAYAQALVEHSQLQTSLEKSIKESSGENELLMLQLHQVQEELESIFLKHEAAQKDSNKIAQARDEQSKLAAERQVKLEALSAEHDKQARQATDLQTNLGHKYKEATQENELLLLQLHQVQEELEHYFLQQQSTQQQLTVAEERWQRMLQRTPDYCDYESIEILPAENNADSTATEPTTCTWRIKNLNAAGRTLPQLNFDTIVEQGMAGLVIHRQPGSAGPLIRWPSAAVKQNDLTLIPFDEPGRRAQRVETLLDLATRDWDLLQTLTQLLATTLEAPGVIKLPADFESEALRSGLDNLARITEEFPATLRYDAVGLKREQVNPDYEHLWLHFDNLAFDGQRWPDFEFRLSCANVRPKLFGKYPKLEFPEETSQAPFSAWFVESYDDFGGKLELRFALPEAIDLGVWQQIAKDDHAFILALIERLPAILLTLQSAGTPLKRPWGDWINMANDIQRIAALHIAPRPAQGSTAK